MVHCGGKFCACGKIFSSKHDDFGRYQAVVRFPHGSMRKTRRNRSTFLAAHVEACESDVGAGGFPLQGSAVRSKFQPCYRTPAESEMLSVALQSVPHGLEVVRF
jgi:hypothetical protein